MIPNDGAKTLAVFIHGQPGSSGDFDEIRQRLSESIPTFSYDRPGWGKSGLEASNVKGNSRYLMDLVVGAGASSVILVGYSYGTAVALQAAIDFPHLINGLVLIAPVGSPRSISSLDRFLAWLGTCVKGGISIVNRLASSERMTVRSFFSFQFEQVNLESDLLELTGGLSSIDLPVSLIVGVDDYFNPMRGSIALYDSLVNGRLCLVRGAGHLVIHQAPERVSAEIHAIWQQAVDRSE